MIAILEQFFFKTLTAYALYQCDETNKSGRVNLNRCAGSQMLIHGYNLMALSPCHFEGETGETQTKSRNPWF